MKRKKISFLIAAHNEEKVIAKTLANLASLPYPNYEIIIGLDGCTDNTERIVKEFRKKSGKIKYYKLNLRQGKPAVINKIIKKAKGEIIIINDADWIFTVKDKKSFEKFISVFNDKKIGGIAESFPLEWKKGKIEGDLGYKMTAYSSYYWFKFQKKNFAYKKNGITYLSEPTMFLTNVFRKKLYEKNFSLGDDFERTKDIMDRGYKVILFEDISMPRMTASYDKIPVNDLFRQKIRTAMARKQLKAEQKIGIKSYYFPAVKYIFKNSWKDGFNTGVITSLWILISSLATFFASFKKPDTRKNWEMRIRR